jgi:hypothetical protein
VSTATNNARWMRFLMVGCIACRIEGDKRGERRHNAQTQVHHLNKFGRAGQKRRGDDFTIPLCCWHHVSLPPDGKDSKWATENMGPSLAKQSKAFRERYGTDDDLLAYTNRLITESYGF